VLVGPNSSGKSDLLRLLANLMPLSSGTVLINNISLQNPSVAARHFGYAAQGLIFWPYFTGREILRCVCALFNLFARQADDRIELVADLLEISPLLDQPVSSYSPANKHHLHIARCLLHDPAVLLLDNPFASLDHLAVHNLQRIIREVLVGQLKKTVLLSSNRLEDVLGTSASAALLHRGQLLWHKPASTISFDGLLKDYKQSLLEAVKC